MIVTSTHLHLELELTRLIVLDIGTMLLKIQHLYNEKHGITPATVKKSIQSGIEAVAESRRIIHRILDDARVSSPHYGEGHLVHEGVEAVVDYLEGDRVYFLW